MRILLLNGPNLNLLGTRHPDVYGSTTLEELEARFGEWAKSFDATVETFQSNHEGALIDRIHQARGHVDAIVFNPGAYTHTSYALHDAVEAVEIPTVETHISNVEERESWRRVSVISPAAVHRIYGRGIEGYRWALRFLVADHHNPHEQVRYGDSTEQFVALRSGDDRLAVLIHGGFWRHMWAYDVLEMNAVDLANRGWSVANIEYRRVGNGGGWPVTRDDVLSAVRSSIEHLGHTGETVLIGHSAGGQLALEAADHLGSEVSAVSMGGVNDLVLAVDDALGDGAALDYLGANAPDQASPLLHPPSGRVVIAHGTDDDRVPFRYAERYAAAHPATLLATAGGDHFRFLDPTDEMWTTIVDAIQQIMTFVIPTAVAVAWLIRVRETPVALVAKPLASIGFLAVAVSSGALESNYGRIVLGGLLLGALGDVVLMFDRWFLVGLVAFASGHVAFLAAFLGIDRPTPISSAIAIAVAVGSAIWLLPRLDRGWRPSVSVYIVVISAMLAVALAPDQTIFVSYGASLFAASDLLVARERFIKSDPRNSLWGLPLYYSGQVLIALSTAT